MLTTLRRSPVLLAHVLLLGVVLIWGTTFTLVKSALADAPPLLFNLLRMTLGFAALAAFNARHLRALTRNELRYGCLAGIFLGLGYQFQTAGLARTSASKTAFITGLVVVIVPLLSSVKSVRPPGMPRPRWTAYGGAFAAFAGLILLTTPSGSGAALLSGIGFGEALSLLCAIAYAAHLLTLGHAAARRTDPRTLGTVQVGVATLLMLITLPLGGRTHLHPSLRLLAAIAITGLFATAAAFTAQSWAQQHLSPTHTALIFTLEPVFAWLTSLVFLHERLTARELSGAALILAGILVSELLGATPAPDPSPQPASNA